MDTQASCVLSDFLFLTFPKTIDKFSHILYTIVNTPIVFGQDTTIFLTHGRITE